MKNLLCFILSCSYSFLSATPYYLAYMQKCIKKNRVDLVENLLKDKTISQVEKDLLLERAHQNVLIKKAEMECFTHNVGLKRKTAGTLLKLVGTIQILLSKYKNGGLIFVGGMLLSKWGKEAEQRASVDGKVNTIKSHEAALSIEQLISKAATNDSLSDKNTR